VIEGKNLTPQENKTGNRKIQQPIWIHPNVFKMDTI